MFSTKSRTFVPRIQSKGKSMKAKLFLAGVAMSALSSAAMAQTTPTSVDGVINFQGAILSDTCKVSSVTGDAGTINVDMGKVAADDIGTVAAPKRLTSGAGSANFDVVCKTGAKVSMKFAGKAADLSADKKTLRVNNGNTAAGFAQGVGIAVYEGTGAGANAYDLSSGDLLAQTTVPSTGGAVNVRFAAAYVAADPTKIKPGNREIHRWLADPANYCSEGK
ncbi:fimbrial protein [Ralstonia mannitolilytica]